MNHLKPRPPGWTCHLFTLKGLESILMQKKGAPGYQRGDEPEDLARHKLHADHQGNPHIPREMFWAALAAQAAGRVLPDGRIVTIKPKDDTRNKKYVRLRHLLHLSGQGLQLNCNGWRADIRQGYDSKKSAKCGIVRPSIELPWTASGHICLAPDVEEFVTELINDAGSLQGFGSYRAEKDGYHGTFELEEFRPV
ncbi:MAG: hypothetical protein V1895_00510 [Parcubacteria group bacterium]